MQGWGFFLYLLGLMLAAWLIYRRIRYDRQAFTKASLQKSTYTLGILALILIVFIGMCVLLLKQG